MDCLDAGISLFAGVEVESLSSVTFGGNMWVFGVCGGLEIFLCNSEIKIFFIP